MLGCRYLYDEIKFSLIEQPMLSCRHLFEWNQVFSFWTTYAWLQIFIGMKSNFDFLNILCLFADIYWNEIRFWLFEQPMLSCRYLLEWNQVLSFWTTYACLQIFIGMNSIFDFLNNLSFDADIYCNEIKFWLF